MNGTDLYFSLNPVNDGDIYSDISTDKVQVVEDFLQGRCHFQPSWRALMFSLDDRGKTGCANRIMHYAEPVQGRYMLCD